MNKTSQVLQHFLLLRWLGTWGKPDFLEAGTKDFASDNSSDVLLCDNTALEFGQVPAIANGSIIEVSLAADDTFHLFYRVLGHAFCHDVIYLCNLTIRKSAIIKLILNAFLKLLD